MCFLNSDSLCSYSNDFATQWQAGMYLCVCLLVKCLLAGDPVVSRWCLQLMLAPSRERPQEHTHIHTQLVCDFVPSWIEKVKVMCKISGWQILWIQWKNNEVISTLWNNEKHKKDVVCGMWLYPKAISANRHLFFLPPLHIPPFYFCNFFLFISCIPILILFVLNIMQEQSATGISPKTWKQVSIL